MDKERVDVGILFHNPWDDTFLCDDCCRSLRDRAKEEQGKRITEGKAGSRWADDAPVILTSVYFIGSDEGPIKIGKSDDPEKRLRELQTGHPWPLRILAQISCEAVIERHYHHKFKDARLSGEWFSRCPEIEAEIARLTPRTHCMEVQYG